MDKETIDKLERQIDNEMYLHCNYCGGEFYLAIGICKDCGGNNDDWESE